MMPPHDNSADTTSSSPSAPYAIYCSPLNGPSDTKATTSPSSSPRTDNGKAPKSPLTGKFLHPFSHNNAMTSESGGIFCAPVSGSAGPRTTAPPPPPPPLPMLPSKAKGNPSKMSKKIGPPPPNAMTSDSDVMVCAPISGSAGPTTTAPPPPVPILTAKAKGTPSKIPKLIGDEMTLDAGVMFCAPISGPPPPPSLPMFSSKAERTPSKRPKTISPPPLYGIPSPPPDAGGIFCAPISGSTGSAGPTTTAPPPRPLPMFSSKAKRTPSQRPKTISPPPLNGIPSSPLDAGGIFCSPINASSAAPPSSTPKHTPPRTKRTKSPNRKPRTINPPPLSAMTMINPAGTGGGAAVNQSAYHPDYMFCGACTTCLPEDEKKTTSDSENLDNYLVHNDHGMSDDSDDDFASAHQTRLKITEFPPNSSPFMMAHGLLLQSLLQPLSGVESVVLDTNEICVYHTLQTSQGQLVAALKRFGYISNIVRESPTLSSSSRDEEESDEDHDQEEEKSQVVRSQFHVGGICCAMEIPTIRKIIKPLVGVEKIQINITTKVVYVQHDARCVSVEAIADSLAKDGFPAEVRVDGSAQLLMVQKQQQLQQHQQSSQARTRLEIRKTTTRVLRQDELNLIRQQLNQVPGIEQVEINVQENCLLVEHDLDLIEAKSIPPLVQGWELEVAAQEELQQPATTSPFIQKSEFVESTLVIEQLQHRNMETLQNIFRQNYIKAQVRAFFAHVPSHTIKVEHNPELLPIHDIPKLLEPYGLNAHVAVDGKEAGLFLPVMEEYGGQHASEGMMEKESDATSSLECHVILSGLFWVLSMLSAMGGIMDYFKYFGLLSVVFGLPPVARKAWRTIKRRQFDSNCMMVTAALGALMLREFDEAASVAFLFSVSEFLEARSTSKARKALEAIVQLRPDHASVINPTTKEITIVPASQVLVGSLLSVRTGDKIAADGVVVEGVSTVDESSLTGESKPIMKRKDDTVSGGTINVGTTQLVVKTTSSVEDSVVSRLIKVVEDAQSSRSKTEKMIDKFAKSYTPFVVCMAGIMCTIPWLWGAEIGRYWTLNGLIIIVIACPCSLTISTPVTYAAGLAATAQRGIIVKGGAHLEALGAVQHVVMDKTGTITHGQFHVDQLKVIGGSRTRKEMLELLALMEAPSSHPLSATLVRAARKEGVSIPKDADVALHTVLKGEGVTAQVNGKHVYVGNKRLFKRIGMYKDMTVADQNVSTNWADNGATVGFIGIEGEGIIGAFSMIDTIRDEASDTIQSLQMSNINVHMLTGDGDGPAQAVAKQIGIPPSSVHSQLLPEDKLHFVGSLTRPEPSGCGPCKERSKVLFIGDGINDTPALAVADVGVSMGDGAAALAMEVSDVTLMDSSLSKLEYVINMGRRVVNTIQENIAFSLLSKLVVVALTFGGKMSLFGAIASDVGVMLMVTLNGMKLLPVTSDLEPKAKRKIRSPKFSPYDKIGSEVDDCENDVELSDVPSMEERTKSDSYFAERRIRTPKFSSYNKISSEGDECANDIEQCVVPSKEDSKDDTDLAAIV